MVWYIIKTWQELIKNKKIVQMASVFLFLAIFLLFKMDSKNEDETKQTVQLGVVDLDESIYSKMIVDYFENIESFGDYATIHIGTENEIKEKFEQGELLAYLIVPEGFAQNLMNIENVPIKAVINTENSSMAIMFRNLLESYEEYISAVQINAVSLYELMKESGMDQALLAKKNIETSIDLVLLALDRESLFDKVVVELMPHTSLQRYYVWAVISLVLLYSSLMAGGLFLKEKELGAYERLRIIGHSVHSVLGAILVSNVMLWSLLLGALIRFITIILNINVPFEYYIFMFCCILISNFISFMMAGVCVNKKTYMIVGNLGLLLMAIVGGVAIPLPFLPEQFLTISKFTPNYHIIMNSIQYSNGIQKNSMLWLVVCTVVSCSVIFVITCLLLDRSRYKRIGGNYATT